MWRITSKILRLLGWFILGMVFLAGAFVMWGSHNGWEFDAVLSGSMVPTFQVGGLVIVKPVNPMTLKVGELISFKMSGVSSPVCHRIIAIQYRDGQKYFQTKGDANDAPDQGLTSASTVNGQVIYHIPYMGRLLDIKNLGSNKIYILGKGLPAAALFSLTIGVIFIAVTLRETIEDILWPFRRWKKKIMKRHNTRLVKRKQMFTIR